jgi:hypothetical protein
MLTRFDSSCSCFVLSVSIDLVPVEADFLSLVGSSIVTFEVDPFSSAKGSVVPFEATVLSCVVPILLVSEVLSEDSFFAMVWLKPSKHSVSELDWNI